jgi:hypothetical protein
MNRIDATIHLDNAAESLMTALEILRDLACTYSIDQRIIQLMVRIDDLRVDVLQSDLPGETD